MRRVNVILTFSSSSGDTVQSPQTSCAQDASGERNEGCKAWCKWHWWNRVGGWLHAHPSHSGFGFRAGWWKEAQSERESRWGGGSWCCSPGWCVGRRCEGHCAAGCDATFFGCGDPWWRGHCADPKEYYHPNQEDGGQKSKDMYESMNMYIWYNIYIYNIYI